MTTTTTLPIGPRYSDGGGAVLMYHSVGVQYPDGRELTVAAFRRHLDVLLAEYDVVSVPELLTGDPAGQVALTFDGGYRNFYTNVFPVLEEYGVPATLFVIPDRIGSSANQNSPLWQEFFPYIDIEQLRELASSSFVRIGNKTMSHDSILPAYRDPDRIRAEVVGAKEWLEDNCGVPVTEFCYPSGRWDPESAGIVDASHECAVLTVERFVGPDTDPGRVPRIDADLVSADTLAERLTTRSIVKRYLHDSFNRLLGGWFPDSDAARRNTANRLAYPVVADRER